METKSKFIKSEQNFWDNPKKVQAILDTVPKNAKEKIEKIIKLGAETESVRNSFLINRPKRLAKVIDQLIALSYGPRAEFPTSPSIGLPMGFIHIELGKAVRSQRAQTYIKFFGNIDYYAGHMNAYETENVDYGDSLVLEHGGSVFFIFYNGLPKGVYNVSLDWLGYGYNPRINIICKSVSDPPTAIDPQGEVAKVTTPSSGENVIPEEEGVDWGSIDMTWRVTESMEWCYFCIINNQGHIISSLGCDFFGLY